MRIWLNLDRMASLDITPQDVVNAINSQNTQAAVGRVGAAPLVPEVEFQLNISTQGRLTTVEEFNNIIVRADSGWRGRPYQGHCPCRARLEIGQLPRSL